jgi:hypothetical protein
MQFLKLVLMGRCPWLSSVAPLGRLKIQALLNINLIPDNNNHIFRKFTKFLLDNNDSRLKKAMSFLMVILYNKNLEFFYFKIKEDVFMNLKFVYQEYKG